MEILQSIYEVVSNIGLLFTYSISSIANGVNLAVSYVPFLQELFNYMPGIMVIGLSFALGIIIVRFFLSFV